MELRRTFNEDAANYNAARPGYMPELIADVLAYRPVTAQSHVLEIGIGTGQATLPFLQTGARLTAVELGQELAEFSRRKFVAFPKFQVVCEDFMNWDLTPDSLDLIISATAFHWLPQEEALRKCLQALNRHQKTQRHRQFFHGRAGGFQNLIKIAEV